MDVAIALATDARCLYVNAMLAMVSKTLDLVETRDAARLTHLNEGIDDQSLITTNNTILRFRIL